MLIDQVPTEVSELIGEARAVVAGNGVLGPTETTTTYKRGSSGMGGGVEVWRRYGSVEVEGEGVEVCGKEALHVPSLLCNRHI